MTSFDIKESSRLLYAVGMNLASKHGVKYIETAPGEAKNSPPD